MFDFVVLSTVIIINYVLNHFLTSFLSHQGYKCQILLEFAAVHLQSLPKDIPNLAKASESC